MKKNILRKICIFITVLLFTTPSLAQEVSLTDTKGKTMKITLNAKTFEVDLDDNPTTRELLQNLPFNLEISDYAGHEYYGRLSFTLPSPKQQTSDLLAGHIYYWDGGNSFVLNYKNYNIAPYHSVHIGKITDKTFVETLLSSGRSVVITVEK